MSRRKKQVCVIGLGHFGRELALTLAGNCEVLAIDRNQEVVDELADKVHRALALDVLDEDALASVIPEDIDEAIVSMGESLEASILCTLYLKRLNVPLVRAKAFSDDHAVVLRQVGADEIVFPERETARRVAAHIANPNLLDFVPLRGDYQVVEIMTPESFGGKTLAQLSLRSHYDVFVIAVERPYPEATHFLPGPDFELLPGDRLVMLGREKDLIKLQEEHDAPRS